MIIIITIISKLIWRYILNLKPLYNFKSKKLTENSPTSKRL